MTVVIDLVAEVLAHFLRYLRGQVVPAVVHGEQHAFDRKIGVQVLLDQLDGVHQRRQPFQRIVLRLDRDQHRVGRGQGVHGQKPQRRRAVDEDVIVIIPEQGDGLLEHALPGDGVDELDLDAHQVDAGRHHVEPGEVSVFFDLGKGFLARKEVVGAAGDVLAVNAHAARGVALRIGVDEQHFFFRRSERGSDVDRGGGLPHAALLIGDCDNSAHELLDPSAPAD